MRFALTKEQVLARDSLRELLQVSCTPGMLRRVFESETPTRVPGLWSELHGLGVFSALAPEAVGGIGLNEIDLIVLLEECGHAAVPELVMETSLVAVPLLCALVQQPRAANALERVLAGQAAVALGLADSPYVVGADHAEWLLLERAGEIHLLESARARLSRTRSVDRTRHLVRVEFEPGAETLLARGDLARQLLAQAFDRAALGSAAQLVGLGTRMLEMTTSHVQTREQFGRPIGAFQAVKHQLVDAHLAITFAAPLVYRAAHSLALEDPERAQHVSMAKAFASDAAQLAARKALQLHGAIGYSHEYDLHLWMKRVWALAAAHGDATQHRKRIADAMLGEQHA
jgi:alkylation response protein AidB-like acyl-CoA dehydrogenase